MKKIILLIAVHLFYPFFVSYICGQIKKGVTHVSDQPSKVDVQTETMEYKEMREADLKQEQYRSEIQEIKRKYDRKIEDLRIYMKRNKTIDQQELSERKQKIENEIREREIETAERKYEFLKRMFPFKAAGQRQATC